MIRREIIHGDAREELARLEPESVDCVVTSPPYFALRDYGSAKEIGKEETWESYIENLAAVFSLARRALKSSGSLWIVIGDTYRNGEPLGIPWRLVFALQDEGWKFRQELIWLKPNAMPESVKRRVSRNHETILFFTKSDSYFFDWEAIREPVQSDRAPSRKAKKSGVGHSEIKGHTEYDGTETVRRSRSVWSISTTPTAVAHLATYPVALAKRCIVAGSPEGGLVLDPFGGSGTTALAALEARRRFQLIELNSGYCGIAESRIRGAQADLF
jgi:DNA modification methylase